MMNRLRPVSFCLLLLIAPMMARADDRIIASRVATGLNRPIYATAPRADANRLFIAEQHSGLIRILDLASGQLAADPFLTIGGLSRGNEQGLLGLAFDPNYSENGFFYVNLTDTSGTTHIRRYRVSDDPSRADAQSGTTVLQYDQPQGNHNGGWMGFHPRHADPYLYIASGDGGAGNDTGQGHTPAIGNAQDTTQNLLGKMLRIDVSTDAFPNDNQRNYGIPPTNPFVGGESDDEIWSYGLRNPWRASFDRVTGDLYIGDVGQGLREEINFRPAQSMGGENFGWRLREGTVRTPTVGGPAPPGHVAPIHDYPHASGPDGGFSVTGGYVYRGPIDKLQGEYFFADFVSNQIWSLQHDRQQTTQLTNWTNSLIADGTSIGSVSSFGEDHAGNLYVVSLNGDVFRLDRLVDVTTILPAGSSWSYLDDGSDQATAWREIDFDDSGWKVGQAEFGYGDNDEATVVEFGPSSADKFATTYFRRTFDIDDVDLIDSLTVGLLYDDGAAVYLNGEEIIRTDNLPENAAFDDFATGARRGEDDFAQFLVDADHLRAGVNQLAVEIHQSSRTSSDMSFDLELNAVFVPEPHGLTLLLGAAGVMLVRQRRTSTTGRNKKKR